MSHGRSTKVPPGGHGGAAKPEFSRVFRIAPDMASGADATRFAIEAEPAERKALARRFGLLALDRLSAEGTVEVYEKGLRARLDGRVVADVVQACVVTLEPLSRHIEEHLRTIYDRDAGGAGGDRGERAEVDIDIEEAEDIEPLPKGGIDLGEAAAECLGLALDPYPRGPGADEALASMLDAEEGGTPGSPFAALERLRKK